MAMLDDWLWWLSGWLIWLDLLAVLTGFAVNVTWVSWPRCLEKLAMQVSYAVWLCRRCWMAMLAMLVTLAGSAGYARSLCSLANLAMLAGPVGYAG